MIFTTILRAPTIKTDAYVLSHTLARNPFMRLCLFIVLIFITTSAYAAPDVSIVSFDPQQTPSTIILSITQNGYEINEPVSTDQKIRLKFQDIPYRIEMRQIYTGAVSDDGPWQDVPHSTVFTKWTRITAHQEIFIPLDINASPSTIKWPQKFQCPSGDTSICDDSKRWTDLYQRCTTKSDDGSSPCYTYQSGLDVRVKYKENEKPEILHFHFPGGC